MHIRQRINSRGDTIVEVLIAISLISFILTGAYIILKDNTRVIQESQERTEATEVLQGQLEETISDVNSNAIQLSANLGSSGFCLVNNSLTVSAGSPNPCTFDSGGNQVTASGATSFVISIVPSKLSGFLVAPFPYELLGTASYLAADNQTQTVQIPYRIYQ